MQHVHTSTVEGGLVPACTGGSTGARDRGASSRVVVTRDGWIARSCTAGAVPSYGQLPVPGPSVDAHTIMLAGHSTIVSVHNA